MDRVDLRLAPSALTSWAVTAAGIVWPVGRVLAIGCLVVGAASALARRRAPPEGTTARAVSTALLAVSVVGAGFGLAVGLRADAVRNHPITAGFGSSAEVTAVPVETPRAVGTGRLKFRADLRRIGDGEMRGRVVVFAPMLGYSQLGAGQPVRFRAGIGRPTRRDLSVAVLTATC